MAIIYIILPTVWRNCHRRKQFSIIHFAIMGTINQPQVSRWCGVQWMEQGGSELDMEVKKQEGDEKQNKKAKEEAK